MLYRKSFKHYRQNAVVILDELLVFTAVIIIFSLSIISTSALYQSSFRNEANNDINNRASIILERIRNFNGLIYQNQSGVFDIYKLFELEEDDILQFVSIPEGYSLTVLVDDLFQQNDSYLVQLSIKSISSSNKNVDRKAVVDIPVNIRISNSEVHPGILTVILCK